MPDIHEDAELAPRDVVARAVEREHRETGRVVLDVSPLDFDATFPDLATLCRDHGVDPASGIPVVPAEHFLCGGVDVDTWGHTSLDRLYAVGECARTGVHGANRLASTSLLEGLVWGLRAGASAAEDGPVGDHDGAVRRASDPPSNDDLQTFYRRLQGVMAEHVGLRRTAAGLRTASTELKTLKREVEETCHDPVSRAGAEVRAACTVGVLVAQAALANERSVGCHYRTGDERESQEDVALAGSS